jgi:hypothetical protein
LVLICDCLELLSKWFTLLHCGSLTLSYTIY